MNTASPTRAALEAALATARATVASLESALAALEATGTTTADQHLDLVVLRERYQLGRGAVLAAVQRGELQASRGARGRILVARTEVERWLASRPVTIREQANDSSVTDLDAWQRRQDEALARAGGRR